MKKNLLSFENKVLLAFTFVLVFGLSAINFVSILFFKYSLDEQIAKETKLYTEIYKYNPGILLPPYIKTFDHIPDPKKYEILNIIDGKYMALDIRYKDKKLKEFAFTLLMWEAVLILVLMVLIYFTIIRYIRKEDYIRRYLEILLLTITHKLGNFLSIQRLNIDIIKSKCRLKAVNRLENAYSIIEKDFKFTIKTLKNLGEAEKNITTINIKDVIENVIHNFQENLKDKSVRLDIFDAYVKMDPNDVENIFFAVIENAAKFCESKVFIKMCSKDKNLYVFIKNDVGMVEKGAGIGLEIAEFLISHYGGEIKTHIGRDFLTMIRLPL